MLYTWHGSQWSVVTSRGRSASVEHSGGSEVKRIRRNALPWIRHPVGSGKENTMASAVGVSTIDCSGQTIWLGSGLGHAVSPVAATIATSTGTGQRTGKLRVKYARS